MAPHLENHTPFPALAFSQFHSDGTDMAVLAVRGSFHVVPNAPLVLAPRQDELELADRYQGDPADGLLIRTCDIVPFKPSADLTILGASWAPKGVEARSWITGVRLGKLEKVLRVHGPRVWRGASTPGEKNGSTDRDWKLSEARPVKAVSLDWRSAFGGAIPGTGDDETPVDAHRFNPIGCGIVDANHSPTDVDIPAPCVEDPADPIVDWRRRDHVPQGFAPLPPVWRSRQQYTGTLDEAWLASKHPLLPDDFDYRFYQFAAPDLILNERLNGDEELQLLHMHPDHTHVQVWLPGIQLSTVAHWRDGDAASLEMNLDGVHVDLTADLATVHLTWRRWVPKRSGVHLMELQVENARRLLEIGSEYVEHHRLTGAPFPE
ncbi:DUF2169 family type VI secretion system accessory protein [Variovorax sp. RB2P76]|uniref:DUF2169 family type VI secretion system accessory protein n=1 Tax=Variovorax sp. RB2P76 TaxID=3443736 RepID=UPI003F456E0B